MDLDHAALGLRDVTDTLFTLVGELGATVIDGGEAVGFRIVQVRMGGMRVELMEPWATDRFDFLARFLDRNGEGPHHLTFKVEGIRDEIARLEALGYPPVRTQLDNPWWREAFFHPKQTFGTVIQVAEPIFDPDLVEAYEATHEQADFGSVEWWPAPPPRAARRAALRRVVIGVPEVEPAVAFFGDVMQGTVTGRTGTAVELAWPGGGRILVEHRPGCDPGVDRLECERDGEPEERTIGGGRFVLRPPG